MLVILRIIKNHESVSWLPDKDFIWWIFNEKLSILGRPDCPGYPREPWFKIIIVKPVDDKTWFFSFTETSDFYLFVIIMRQSDKWKCVKLNFTIISSCNCCTLQYTRSLLRLSIRIGRGYDKNKFYCVLIAVWSPSFIISYWGGSLPARESRGGLSKLNQAVWYGIIDAG